MVPVKACAEFPVQVSNDTTSDGDTHSKHVDQNENFILDNAAEGDEKVILKHVGERLEGFCLL